MSPEEISIMLGGLISSSAVAARAQTLLTAKDWLSEVQEDQLVTLRMKQLVLELIDSKSSGDYKYLDIRLKALTALGDRLDKRKKATDVDLGVLYANQGQIMARIYDIAMSYVKGALRSEIDPARWDELQKEALLHARAELAKHEAVEA